MLLLPPYDSETTMKTKSIYLLELEEEYKRFFESKLAGLLDKEFLALHSIKKVSQAILMLLKKNKEEVIERFRQDAKIKKELFGKEFYGHLTADDNLTEENIYSQVVSLLEDYSRPSCILQLHALFIHRIFDHLKIKSLQGEHDNIVLQRKSKLCTGLFSENLFKNRSRQEINSSALFTTVSGINRNKYFQNKLNVGETHSPALFRFQPDNQSPFFLAAKTANMPFVAGPSGHMGSFLLGALLFAELSQDDLKEYAFGCSAFLISGGNHSFHECMVVAQQIGIPYTLGNYVEAIPDTIKKTATYQSLQLEFTEFLGESFPVNQLQN